jgi:transcriptional regulator with XRE-family HTH domain
MKMKINAPDTVRRKHPGGRPTKRTPAMLDVLSDAIAAGMTDEQAAQLAGISRSTLAEWLKAEDEFSDAIKKARAMRLRERLRRIESCCPNWQAIAWILERTYGNQFAPPKTTAKVEHSLSNGMSDEHIKKAEELLRLM